MEIDLLSTLKENLKQMKRALDERIEYKNQLSSQNCSEEELANVESEIITLSNAVAESESAISSVSKMKSTDEFKLIADLRMD